jgi:FtsZ-binding cell division protein ZapB
MTRRRGHKTRSGGANQWVPFCAATQPTGFTKAERTNLMHILGRLDEVQAYRTRFGQTKGEQKLQRHNNPSSVWRAFLKDIGELKEKEGTGKKSTLKDSVAELSEECDALRKENQRLSDAVNEGDWEQQITAIVGKVDADELAKVVFAADDTTGAIGLTEALVTEYGKVGNIMEVVDLDPNEVIRHNSQKARKLADAILNELDGQTDEPNDERLARRIVNGRGAHAAWSLAQAILAQIENEIAEAPFGGVREPATEATAEQAEPPHPSGKQAKPPHPSGEPVEPPKVQPDEPPTKPEIRPTKGDIKVTGWGPPDKLVGIIDGDDPRATGWYVKVWHPASEWKRGSDYIQSRAQAEAAAVRVREMALSAEDSIKYLASLDRAGNPPCAVCQGMNGYHKPDCTAEKSKGEAVPAAQEAPPQSEKSVEPKKRGPKPQPKLDELGRPARPEMFDQHIAGIDANNRRCDAAESPDAVRWIVEIFVAAVDKRKRGEWNVIRRCTSLAEAIAYVKDGKTEPPPPNPLRGGMTTLRIDDKTVFNPKYFTGAPTSQPVWLVESAHFTKVCSTEHDAGRHAQMDGSGVISKTTIGEVIASYSAIPEDDDKPRMGQKRVVGVVEGYFVEVFRATDQMPDGEWIRPAKTGWPTREEAENFL